MNAILWHNFKTHMPRQDHDIIIQDHEGNLNYGFVHGMELIKRFKAPFGKPVSWTEAVVVGVETVSLKSDSTYDIVGHNVVYFSDGSTLKSTDILIEDPY